MISWLLMSLALLGLFIAPRHDRLWVWALWAALECGLVAAAMLMPVVP